MSKQFRAWWISPIPGRPMYIEFETEAEARAAVDALAAFDEHRIDQGLLSRNVCNVGGVQTLDSDGEWEDLDDEWRVAGTGAPKYDGNTRHRLPIHRTEAGYPNCATCDGGGCHDCTDPA